MAMEDSHPDVQQAPQVEETPKIPDYLASPNAVFADKDVQWRYGRAPDYTKTRKVWAEGKRMNHAPGSLEEMVENLVKNWEVEASFKPRLSDWRTIDHEKYSFAMGGGPPQDAEHMIRVGTYNGIIAPNEYYSPENSDFASSHKTFKRMMPNFAWEVLEVYSGPPRVSFRWRHWGYMKNDYVGFNDKGQKVTAKAHGGIIDIEGVIVAEVDDKVRLQAIQVWMDPLEMFRQIAPHGIVNKETMNRNVSMEDAIDVGPNDTAPATASGCGCAPATQEQTQESTSGIATPKPAAGADDQPVTALNEPTSQAPSEPQQAATQPSTERPQPSPSPAIPGAQQEETAKAASTPAQTIVETAAAQGTEMDVDKPESNAKEVTEVIPRVETTTDAMTTNTQEEVPRSIYSSSITGDVESIITEGQRGDVDESQQKKSDHEAISTTTHEDIHPHPKDTEQAVKPDVGEAVVADQGTEETRITHEEMSRIGVSECPFMMNRE